MNYSNMKMARRSKAGLSISTTTKQSQQKSSTMTRGNTPQDRREVVRQTPKGITMPIECVRCGSERMEPFTNFCQEQKKRFGSGTLAIVAAGFHCRACRAMFWIHVFRRYVKTEWDLTTGRRRG